MQHARGAVRGLYICALLTAGLILTAMTYVGAFDGLGNALFDTAKDIANFFWTECRCRW